MAPSPEVDGAPGAPGDDLREHGARVERVMEEVRAMAGPTTWARIEELLEAIVRLYGAGLRRALEITATGSALDPTVADRLASDELVSSLLLLHGLHPVPAAERVERAIEALGQRLAGDAVVTLVGLGDDGVVRVRVEAGEDRRCGFSAAALGRAVEQAILEAAPEIAGVEVLGLAPPAAPERLVAIGRPALDAKVHP